MEGGEPSADRDDPFVELAVWIEELRQPQRLPAVARRRVKWSKVAAWGFVALLAWLWWTTAASTSHARIAALQTVEPYAFSVHEQLVRNFGIEGRFFQTIHKGYDDAWTWSGHRALTLIASIKARRNPVLGLWWRYHTWMSKLGQKGVVVALLGAYMVYRVVAQATEDLGHANLSEGIEYAWLGVCAFTWFGPVIFKRMVDKELGRVELDPDF